MCEIMNKAILFSNLLGCDSVFMSWSVEADEQGCPLRLHTLLLGIDSTPAPFLSNGFPPFDMFVAIIDVGRAS